MKHLLIAGALALALMPAAAMAQHAKTSAAPAGFAPEYVRVIVPAISVPISGTATVGTTVVGPFAPDLGREIRVVLRGTWAGSFVVGTSVDSCATINALTIGGSAWGNYTANANEVVDVPTLAGVGYCATATITSGSLSWAVRQ